MKTVSWFSAGVSSAVATKIAIDAIDEIIYTHIDDQHEDTMRFVLDCQDWFGKKITILQSPYKSVENVLNHHFYVGINGAECTRILKRQVRIKWEYNQTDPLRYIWGFDRTEADRAERLIENMPKQQHRFPLIEQLIDKNKAHEILRASGIQRPAMYNLGYHNNNCIGCVKGGAGYWNKIRIDFPEIFKSRAELERKVNRTFCKMQKNGKTVRVYLDELNPNAGRHQSEIMDDCGIMCELMKL